MPVASGSCSVPGLQPRVASGPLAASASATAAGRGSSAGAIAGAGHGLTSNSTAFCPSLPHEFLAWAGGLLAAASTPRSALPLFGPPEQKSSSSPLLEQVTARRSPAFRCSAGLPPRSGVVRTCGGGTGVPFVMALRMPVFFVHCGCRGLNMYVISARSRVFSSFSSTKTCLLII